MMPMHLPLPERDVPAVRDLSLCAPKFAETVRRLLAEEPDAMLAETVRTAARQSFLYGFGREYDDGRGIVTQAPTHLTSWHGYGLGCDVVHREHRWDAPPSWFRHMGALAETHDLTWGGRWRHPDLPHVQWGGCPDTPTYVHRGLYVNSGVEAVWKMVGAAA